MEGSIASPRFYEYLKDVYLISALNIKLIYLIYTIFHNLIIN